MSLAVALREQLGKVAYDMSAILAKCEKEPVNCQPRGLTKPEQEQYDNLHTHYRSLETDIERVENHNKIEKFLATTSNPTKINPGATAKGAKTIHADAVRVRNYARTRGLTLTNASGVPVDEDPQSIQYENAFWNYMRAGQLNISQEDRDTLRNGWQPHQQIQNALSTTTGSQGGYVVPVGFSNMLEEAIKWFGGMDVCGKFTTETGNQLQYPTINDTNQTGEIIGQNTAVSYQDVAFGQLQFLAYIFSSKMVLVPEALLTDSYFDLPGRLSALLGIRLSRIKNTKLTIGSGTNEPTGIVTAAVAAGNTYVMPTGSATSVTYNSLTEIKHKVDPGYRDTSTWMFNDTTLKKLDQLVDASNRPLWQPGLTASFREGAGVVINKPLVLGNPYVINNDMPVMAANANSILFGEISKYLVREVAGGVTMRRLVERYAELLQEGFFGYMRLDGQLLDAGTHPIAVGVNSAT